MAQIRKVNGKMEATDSFGVTIEEGDYILSAATSGWTMTLGYARFRPNTLAVEVVKSSHSFGNKLRQVGSWVAVLRKTNGFVPAHVVPPPSITIELPGMWDESDLIGGETDNG